MRQQVIRAVLEYKIVAIVRGVEPEQAVKIAQALYDGGIRLVEVTFNQKDPASFLKTVQAIRGIQACMQGKMLVGAGTVTTEALVEMAAEAGASYIISPDTDTAVIRRTRELGLVSIPGAYTATEAKTAHCAGADFVKLFPCIGDAPAYVKALCAPFNHIRFLAVGGVTSENAADFLKAGAVGLGISSSLANKAWADSGEYWRITEEAKKIVSNISKK